MAPKSRIQTQEKFNTNSTSIEKTENSPTASSKLLNIQRRMLSSHGIPFLFIADGDFSIVWVNVVAFAIGHLVYFYSMYILFFQRNHNTDRTWLFGK